MKTNTKLKHLLKDHTIGISLSGDEWGMTVISIRDFKDRKNYTGGSFFNVVTQAHREIIKKKINYGSKQQESDNP